MILSFHPCIEADKNIICAGRDPGHEELSAIKNARAVILPQGCRESLYKMATTNCSNVFPNYDALFKYPGKTGQARLFKDMDAKHPKTFIFDNLKSFYNNHKSCPMNFPCVFKFSWGGEGRNVFLLESDIDFSNILINAKKYEDTGQFGFVIQEYIPTGGKSLRVVIMGSLINSYWRLHEDGNSFYSNIAKGAGIDKDMDPELQKKAAKILMNFCLKTGINLAGFDFLFDASKKNNEPLFLEINYFFGRKGLGGIEKYYELLYSIVKEWIRSVDK